MSEHAEQKNDINEPIEAETAHHSNMNNVHLEFPNTKETEVSELEWLRQENNRLKDQWLRSVADAENLRKRSEREVQEARKYAATEFARDMVNVAENLKRALDSLPESAVANHSDALVKTIHSGVEMTMKELLNIFERHGIKRIDPIGQPFDHNLHQAVAQLDDHKVKAGDVCQVIQAGYTMHDRLLRPAMVAVAKAPAAPIEHVDTKA